MLWSKRFILLAMCSWAVCAWADPVDLTAPGSNGLANGGYFEVHEASGTGTGNFQAVVRLKNGDPTVMGHNTTYDEHVYFNNNSVRQDFRINDLPIVGLDGVPYFEFLLDINEPKGGTSELLSLEEVKIYTSPYAGAFLDPQVAPDNPPPPRTPVPGTWYQEVNNVQTLLDPQPVLRYNMDGAGDTAVLMDSALISGGQGNMDVRMLVPVSTLFTPDVVATDQVYLWSAMGSSTQYKGQSGWEQDATFEEWAINAEISTLPSGGDWGDLPESAVASFPQANFPTTEAGNSLGEAGAVHLSGFYEWLGPGTWTQTDPDDPTSPFVNPSWDSEEDGAPSEYANADDTTESDDEDGVEYFVGTDDEVTVTLSVRDHTDTVRYSGSGVDEFGRDGLLHLDAWWDRNGDGVFFEGDPLAADYDPAVDEHVVRNRTYDPSTWGADTFVDTFSIPGFAPAYQTPYWRWRLNYARPNLYFGASSYGEVEDYWVTPEPVSLVLFGVPLAVLARSRRRRRK